jgi:hypothetical protein
VTDKTTTATTGTPEKSVLWKTPVKAVKPIKAGTPATALYTAVAAANVWDPNSSMGANNGKRANDRKTPDFASEPSGTRTFESSF